jgi:hypothetical protein
MTKLDYHPPALTFPTASPSDPPTSSHRPDILSGGQRPQPARRLIVLFPASEADTPELSHRIWEIARSLQANVLLLSLTNDFDEESRLRRNLITMAAIIRDPSVSTDILIEHGSDWAGQVKKIWQTGDTVACYAGQKVGIMHKSLEQVLRSKLEAPIYILSSYQPATNPNPTFWLRVSAWSGSLAIIGGFLWAEVKIGQLPQDWAYTALICTCIFVEIVLLFLWNSLFS